jgi:hypothetical protein
MINPATRPSNELNSFTHMIVEYDVLGWADRWVKLCNGTLVRPVYKEAEDEYCEDAFYAEGYRYCWNLDGTSVTSRDYDMMEIVRND